MTTHTDRIKQMAQQADEMAAAALGVGTYERWSDEFASKRDAAFAQLVAEDCARVCESRYAAERIKALANEGWSNDALAAYASCAEGLDIAIRARYSLKD